MAIPLAALTIPNVSAQTDGTAPEVVQIGIYVQDLNQFSLEYGTIDANFYLTIRSESNVSLGDIDLMNGQITSVDVIRDVVNYKEYRITAALTANPDLRRFPFDRHIIPIDIEPKIKNEQEMVLVINQGNSGLDPEADLPGWGIAEAGTAITNKSYIPGEIPYSRAVFNYAIERDVASTVSKFFLPIMLIITVALSSLMIKFSSRLGLNASMFLSAVLIHWRVADSIPLVAYATFMDLFMIITYITLVMVLVSGILMLTYNDVKDLEHAALVNRWSIRIIPILSITLYGLLILFLLT
jgi:hypothetical protein